MPTDPQHFKWKADNDLKTTIISIILVQLTFFSFLLVLNLITCLFRALTINFSTFLPFLPIFKKEKIQNVHEKYKDFRTYRLYSVFGMLVETRLFLFYA